MRKVKVVIGYNKLALGSCLFSLGNTRVLCNATLQPTQPPHLAGTNNGWVTAEYFMLPQATDKRNSRQQQLNSGRTKEISRIIGRSLRAAVDTTKLGPNTIIIDCDVLQADGGTRTAAINGAFIALYTACRNLLKKNILKEFPVKKFIGSISVGIVNEKKVVDLCQQEDNNAEVDMTVVMTEQKELVEVEFTAEKKLYPKSVITELISLAEKNILQIIKLQKKYLKVK